MIKSKSLHSITIECCNINTRLDYNTNTDHMGIRTPFQYQDPNKTKKYQKDNKNEIKQRRENCKDPNITIQGSDEHRRKMSCIKREIPIEDFPGFSRERKYCYKFNDSCRESNREKYNYKCFICDKAEENNGKKLSVHHIDMNKDQGCNGNEWKLIPVCSQCHGMLHTKLWKNRIEYLLECDR